MAERFLSVTEVKKSFCELVRGADSSFDRIIITRGGHPVAVLLAYDDYAGLEETLEIMSDPELGKGSREGIEDERAGRVLDYETVKRELLQDAPAPTHAARQARSKGASARRTRARAGSHR
jgi:prevent-host-death family protein